MQSDPSLRHLVKLLFLLLLLWSSVAIAAPDRIVVVEAESGALGSDYLTATGSDATYITAGTDFAATAAPGVASKVASYTVTFPQAGTYHLYIRLRVGPAGGSDDSFYYGNGLGAKAVADGGAWILVNNIVGNGYTAPTDTVLGAGSAGGNVWKWMKFSTNNYGEPGPAFVVPADALTQTFQLGTRENGLDIDRFAFALADSEYLVAHFTNTRPVIDAGQTFAVAEGADTGTSIGAVLATDPDPAAALKNWTITGGTGASVFSIDATTGVLSLADGAALDAETTPSYTLMLSVDDAVSTSAVQTVTVNVEKPQSILVFGPAAGRYGVGQTLSFTVLLGRSMFVDTTGGVPAISVAVGDHTRAATYVSGSGTNRLEFAYTAQLGDNDLDGVTIASPIVLNGGTIRNSDSVDVGLTFTPPDLSDVIVDTIAPAAPMINALDGSTLSGTAEPGSLVAVFLDDALAGSATADAAGNWTFHINHWALGTGTHNISVTAVASDDVGNIGPASEVFPAAIVVDPLAPIVLEAESGALGSDFATTTANGVTYITNSTNFLSPATAPQSAAKVASYTVTFPQAGVYNLYVRIWVSDGGFNDDSFYYGNGLGEKNVTDGNAWVLVNGMASAGFHDPVDYVTPTDTIWGGGGGGVRTWKWVRLSSSNWGEAGVQFTATEGALTQTFQIGSREDGLLIDKVAFGLDGVYFTVPNLDTGGVGTTATPPPPYIPPGPPFATGKAKFLGSFFSHPATFDKYWNQVVPGNAGKWGSVEGTRDVMNWAELDTIYAYAKSRGFPFKLHTLIWGNQQPAWIETLPPTEQLAEIEEWFAAVAARYPDIEQIDVVNEPLHDPPNQPGQGGGNYANALGGTGATGWDWVLNAFRIARRHFPESELLINDYSITNNTSTTQNYLALINLLKAENLVDGIGLQQHAFETRGVPTALLASNTDLLATAGLPLYITEMDFDGETDQVQLDEVMRLFPLWWEHPAVAGITMGGFSPPVWRQAQGAYLTWTNGVERPALQWMRDYVIASNPPLRPMILAQPIDASAPALQTVTFTFDVNANPAPAIRWQQSADGGATWTNLNDDSVFSGATTTTLTITGAPYAFNQALFRAVASNATGTLATAPVVLTVSQLPATIALGALNQLYDGSPRIPIAGTSPAGLPVSFTFDGDPTPPIYPGSYAVVATIADNNYSGFASATLNVDTTARVRHAPILNGGLDGSIQVLASEDIALNGSAWVSGDLLVPGTPAVRLNGQPSFGGTIDGPGAAGSTSRTVMLNGGAVLRHLVRRIDPLSLPVVAAPPAPQGTRSVTLNQPGQSAGDFATLKNLTLNGNVGVVPVPSGAYGNFVANGGSGFALGVAGSTEPAVYALQSLTLNGGARLQIAGPVILVLKNSLSVNSGVVFSEHPAEWLTIEVASGSVSLNGATVLPAAIVAPNGTVTLNDSATLRGSVKSARLVVNDGAVLEKP